MLQTCAVSNTTLHTTTRCSHGWPIFIPKRPPIKENSCPNSRKLCCSADSSWEGMVGLLWETNGKLTLFLKQNRQGSFCFGTQSSQKKLDSDSSDDDSSSSRPSMASSDTSSLSDIRHLGMASGKKIEPAQLLFGKGRFQIAKDPVWIAIAYIYIT